MQRVLYADMAQLVAQLICNQWVAGSIPVVGTIKMRGQSAGIALTFFDSAVFFPHRVCGF